LLSERQACALGEEIPTGLAKPLYRTDVESSDNAPVARPKSTIPPGFCVVDRNP